MYAEFAHALIHTARLLYAQDSFDMDLANAVYALDATTIDPTESWSYVVWVGRAGCGISQTPRWSLPTLLYSG